MSKYMVSNPNGLLTGALACASLADKMHEAITGRHR
ncbi:hypothetical protein GGQ99_005102 [Aminobacter niigataensis]|uniref:Uncharacterized protein n=1 Tax=Aminobacter niigataensis TaxID=83265 RepID=A0ABR6L922_9HYPH|nr:hypothetical protein [Aminobacter niigataensis]